MRSVMTNRALFGPGVVLCLALFVAPAAGQVGVSTDPTSSVRTRSELEALGLRTRVQFFECDRVKVKTTAFKFGGDRLWVLANQF